MKTTFNIDDTLMARLRQEAARRGCTMFELVEMALRTLFRNSTTPRKLPKLPSWNGGKELVDIFGRDALYRTMEGR